MSQNPSFRRPVSGEFVSLRDAMDRLLSAGVSGSPCRTLWTSANGRTSRRPLPLDVDATADEVVIVAAAPGPNLANPTITVDHGAVMIGDEIPNAIGSIEAKQATRYLHELPSGTFRRGVPLPFEVDAARADAAFEHGILRPRLPKAEQARPKQITVRVPGAETAALPES